MDERGHHFAGYVRGGALSHAPLCKVRILWERKKKREREEEEEEEREREREREREGEGAPSTALKASSESYRGNPSSLLGGQIRF